MQLVLRSALRGDAWAVTEVLLESRRAFIPYAPMSHGPLEIRQWVEHTLIPAGGVTVACISEVVVGFLATSTADGIDWIDQLYVAPGFVGQGIGARLLGHGLASLARPVRLYCFQANLRARRFYETHGFNPIAFTDGSGNEERCPDVLLELATSDGHAA